MYRRATPPLRVSPKYRSFCTLAVRLDSADRSVRVGRYHPTRVRRCSGQLGALEDVLIQGSLNRGEEWTMHMIGVIILAICTALGVIIPLFG